jgi:uncharacterized membrane protein
MIKLDFVFWLMGAMMAGVALVNLVDAENPKRVPNAAFWGLYAVTFLAGQLLPNLVNGLIVIAMVLVASIGRVGQGRPDTTSRAERQASAERLGNRLFVPALTIPLVTFLGSTFLKYLQIGGQPLVDPKQATLISLGIATLVALAIGYIMLRPPALSPIVEGRRLLDSVGWAAVLPQSLAALGVMFTAAGVGPVVASLLGRWIPLDSPLVVVLVYALGMALFTMIMGNAFAAFPVMTAALGLPLLVQKFGGDPAIVCAIGMLSGFCGTLMTPMAANFNIVPVALLDLPDQHAVIKKQIPTGLLLLVTNATLMYLLAFRS